VCRLADEPVSVDASTQPGKAAERAERGRIDLQVRDMPPIRQDLLELFEKEELIKYLTDEELTGE
jgi:succinate dehydrogenase / fumarate reductase, flavoprotein subunit